MAAKKGSGKGTKGEGPKPVEAIVHDDKRPNLPSGPAHELVDPALEAANRLRYPRDPSLDPQLVWKGKDEQDDDLEVDAPPIYIQEKIDPRVLVENLRKTAAEGELEPEATLFEQFDGLGDLDLVEFYRHDANWSNRMILGDSLNVMASLADREGLRGQVQMIYMDPPYGIKFGSNWQVNAKKRDVQDGKVDHTTREAEVVRAFRDTWELGIHSYLAYLRDRLVVARDLLTESGSVFVQIGDENVHLVRSVMDEVFGSDCFVVEIVIKKKGGQRSSYIDSVNDYLLWYSKTSRQDSGGGPRFHALFEPRPLDHEVLQSFRLVELADGAIYPLREVPGPDGRVIDYRVRPQQLDRDHPGSRLVKPDNLTSGGFRRNQSLPFTWEGVTFEPKAGNSWKHTAATDDGSPSGMERLGVAGRLLAGEKAWSYKRYFTDFPFVRMTNWWDGLGGAGNPIYVVQTNSEIVKRCILMTTDPGDLVLDPTCGSGTTAVVAEQWGRRWITIDASRVSVTLARTRVMGSHYPYYLLVDSEEGAAAEADQTGSTVLSGPYGEDVRRGFVLKRQPHITSSTIANCQEITKGMTRDAMDKAILRTADVEALVNQPVEGGKTRVSGPFTVESLAPHRSLAYAGDEPASERAADADPTGTAFEQTILDNLSAAGVQNGRRNERLEFDLVEPYAGTHIQAVGICENPAEGAPGRTGIAIGPQYGTVGPGFVKDATIEARRAGDLDLLCVLGFAFDPHAVGAIGDDLVTADESFEVAAERSLGGLPVLLVRMNSDLLMGEDLKKTGAGNLFTVFGEPDIELAETPDGEVVVTVEGIDVYDPTTGELRHGETDQIALWMIDTDYDGESFFVRHCYFTGGNDPYERLKKTLRAEIEADAWDTLYQTESRPFPKPETGRIAVKVINDYGDEVMKVFEVG